MFFHWPSGPKLSFMKLSVVLSGIILLIGGYGCGTKNIQQQGVGGLYDQFEEIVLADSFHIGPEFGEEVNIQLSAPGLLQAFSDSQLQQIYFQYDSAVTQTFGVGKFQLDASREACLLRMTESWWVFLGMAVYDTQKEQFIGLYPLTSLYGGDGGQEVKESWLMTGAEGRVEAIVIHQLERWMEIEEDDVVERRVHAFERSRWNGSEFEIESLSDSARLVKAFPIDW